LERFKPFKATTDAIKFAVENNIDIVFLNHFSDPYGIQSWEAQLLYSAASLKLKLQLLGSISISEGK
jgi:CRISPR-associated protein Cas1